MSSPKRQISNILLQHPVLYFVGISAVLAITSAHVHATTPSGVTLTSQRLFSSLLLLFGPGLGALFLLDRTKTTFSTFVTETIAISMVLDITIGISLSQTFSGLGIAEPLSVIPILGTTAIVSIGLLSWATYIHGPLSPPSPDIPRKTALVTISAFTVFGLTAGYLLTQGARIPILVVLAIIASTPAIFYATGMERNTTLLLIWAIALIMSFHGVILSSGTTQWFAPIVAKTGVWVPTYGPGRVRESVLFNSVLTPMYMVVMRSDVAATSQLYTVLSAHIPILIFKFSNRQISVKHSYLIACLFMFSFPFYKIYPQSARVVAPAFYLMLLLSTDSAKQPPLPQKFIGLISLLGIAISHYGTAYLVLFALTASVFAYYLLNVTRHATGFIRGVDIDHHIETPQRPLSLTYVWLFGILTVYWYASTSGGYHFQSLVIKLAVSIVDLLALDFGGTASETVSQSFSSISIQLSKQLFILFGLIMGIGALYYTVQRVFAEVDDEKDTHYALLVGFLSMFGASFMAGTAAFNIARILMIIFAVSGVLVIYGTHAIAVTVSHVVGNFSRVRAAADVSLCSLLLVFLLLNSGVVSQTITHDPAPSNFVVDQAYLQGNSDETDPRYVPRNSDEDLTAAIWIYQNTPETNIIYGDFYVKEIYTEYYLARIVERTGFMMRDSSAPAWPQQITQTCELRDGLVFKTSVNTKTGLALNNSWYDYYSLSQVESLKYTGKVYTTGNTSALTPNCA